MALVVMAVYDTEENKRSEYTEKTLHSLFSTIHNYRHRIIVVDNNSCKLTKDIIESWKISYPEDLEVITLQENIGTARAVNLGWRLRKPGEHCIKMDNDVIINHNNWVDEMEEAIARDPNIGQVGLKRKDCWESPWNEDPHYRSEIRMLKHVLGESWIIVEEVNHVMGTCVMHSSALLDKVGYLYQPKLYGFDDALMSFRSNKAGFKNVFLPTINIDHIDSGETSYQKWKEDHASECWSDYHRMIGGYVSGSIPLYYNPYGSDSNTNLQ